MLISTSTVFQSVYSFPKHGDVKEFRRLREVTDTLLRHWMRTEWGSGRGDQGRAGRGGGVSGYIEAVHNHSQSPHAARLVCT